MTAEGGVSKLQTERQQQEVLSRQAEVERLTTEQQRLAIAISQAESNCKTQLLLRQRYP
jgi:hypothetical protein